MDVSDISQVVDDMVSTPRRNNSVSSLSSAGFEPATNTPSANINNSINSNNANANANAIQPNTTGNSVVSSRVSQSRHFGNNSNALHMFSHVTQNSNNNFSNVSVANTSSINNLDSFMNDTAYPSASNIAMNINTPTNIGVATASATVNAASGAVNTTAHSINNEESINDLSNITSSTIGDLNDKLSMKLPSQQQIQQLQPVAQQPNITGSTNNSFNPNWLPQQNQSSLLNVTPWIEQQAQISPNLNYHNQYSINPLSSHSTGNTANNLDDNHYNLTTNLSLLTSQSAILNPINQLSKQHQLRQPQYMKNLNQAQSQSQSQSQNPNMSMNISPPNNNNNETLNTTNQYYQNYQSFQPYQSSYANSNASNVTVNKNTNNNFNQHNNTSSGANNNTTTTTNTNNNTNNNTNTNNNHNNSHNHNNNNSNNHNNNDDDDELIPTAIVIKNIPFAIKKEQLLDVMSKLNLPLPYAFNYHFDNGVFRGLAFANFNSIEETAVVVSMMNGREIDGRKLRVEYKKMLPLQERERIEREKKEKRCQLEEQHRSTSVTSLASLYSTASAPPTTAHHAQTFNIQNITSSTNNTNATVTPSTNPSTTIPVNNSGEIADNINTANSTDNKNVLLIPKIEDLPQPPSDVNFNDAEVLDIYTKLVLFKENYNNDNDDNEITLKTSTLTTNGKASIKHLIKFLDLIESNNQSDNVVIQRHPSTRNQIKPSTEGNNIVPSITLPTPSNFQSQPSLIRSQSHSLLNSTPGLALNSNRYRQQSPRTVSQTQQYGGYNQAQSSLGLNLNGINLSSLNSQQQQQQQPQIQLQHSNSNVSLNLLRNKGLTAPTTPNTARHATFSYNVAQTPNLFNGFNNAQMTGGSNISANMSNMGKGMDDLYAGMEYLSFDNNNNNNANNGNGNGN